MLSTLYLVAEDELGLAVGRRLVGEVPNLSIWREENARGYAGIQMKTPSYHQMGFRMPVLALTDLDARPCPSGLVDNWLSQRPSPGFLLRVCVREVEAWLLADPAKLAKLLNIPIQKIPTEPEQVPDPKRLLIQLAKKASKRVRTALTPVGSAAIGPGYNDVLSQFVMKTWDPAEAATRAPSLAKARLRLHQLGERIASFHQSVASGIQRE